MPTFSPPELEYLTTVHTLGRIVTVEPSGSLHVVPVGWRYDADHDAIEVSGRQFAATKKFRNVKSDARVAFLVDDVLPPWRPRAVMVQGWGEAVDADGEAEARIRITPEKIVSWGL